MKTFALVAAIAGVASVISLSNASPAAAQDSFSFSFDTGAVAFAYSDGYWDREHHWHKWHNSREAREYRSRYADHYNGIRHTRAAHRGWRDEDHDGIPNKFDHDRDGDGVPNRRDDAPNNPYRR